MLQNIRSQIDVILEKDMDRRQFLTYSLVAILAVVGISRIASTLNGMSKPSAAAQPTLNKGAYGGKVKSK